MRYYISLLAIAVISISMFTACQNAASSSSPTAARTDSANPGATETPKGNSQPEDPLAKVARISLADAKKAFDEGSAVFVDTRAEVQYKQEHIKGAINIPAEAFQTRYAEVPKDKKIITYCS
ncbi:MAG TPA: rhodanese-like domain-containing protein [Pyrinomonadaceae bacterium]|jgi:3-mercaptopyruvate sulfurtransferase SseA